MSSLQIFHPSHCLVTRLVAEFLRRDPATWRRRLVVLPTQRVATFFLAALSEHVTAFQPPRLMTLEQFIRLHAGANGGEAPDGVEELLLAQSILENSAELTHIKPGNEREAALILAELTESGLAASGLQKLKEVLIEDIYHSQEHLGSLYRRAEEMEVLYNLLNQRLTELGLMTRSQVLCAAASHLCQNWQEEASWDYEGLYFIGFTSVQKSWFPLLGTLVKKAGVELWLHACPDIYSRESPLGELITYLKEQAVATYHAADAAAPRKETFICEVPSAFAEVALVLHQAQDLVAAGCPPSQIGIFVTSEQEYGPILRSLVRQMAVEANLALGVPVQQTVAGHWLELFCAFVALPTDPRRFTGLIQHPITLGWLQRQLVEPVDEALLREGLRQAFARLSYFPALSHLPALVADELLRKALGSFAGRLQVWLAGRQNPEGFTRWLQEFNELIADFALTSYEEDDGGISESLKENLQGLLASLDLVSRGSGKPLCSTDFLRMVAGAWQGQVVRSTGEPLAGIQIVSLAEARAMPFAAAFILGCNEDTFPKALPKDELLDDYLKRRMGLPGWQKLEAMEDVTFHLLKARIPALYLFRNRGSAENPAVPSRFISKLLNEKGVKNYTPDFMPAELFSRFAPATSPGAEAAPALEGRLGAEGLFSPLSASAAESFLRCPYRFLLGRLRLREERELFPEEDPQREGEWLHAVIEAFFTSSHAGKKIIDDWPEALTPDGFYEVGLRRLVDITKGLAPPGIEFKPIYHQLLSHSWPKFLKHVMAVYGNTPFGDSARGLREYEFKGVKLKLAGKTVEVRGIIDSIDVLPHMTVLTDYKRKTLPALKDVLAGISPQLAFYVLVVQQQNLPVEFERLLVGYFSILSGEWLPVGVGAGLRSGTLAAGLSRRKTPDLNEITTGFLQLWRWRMQHALAEVERFYADPSACSLCAYAGVCRRDDPVHRERLLAQSFLAEQMAASTAETSGKEENIESSEPL